MKHFTYFSPPAKRLAIVFLLLLGGLFPPVQAQNTVTGRVIDANTQDALVGCSVLVKGTQRGTNTDANGNYSIAASDGNTLIFGFIGFEKQEIPVGNRSKIDVVLKSSSSDLSQVVVIGYGTTAKKDMTGSVKSLQSTEFNKGIINSPEQLLQGKVAGVNVTSASGEPGGSQSITIRGPGGVRTGSTPLFVLDGLALDNSSTGGATNPLTFLNPQDIESIDVLKDASATAIYGSRGANGVVLITTKKGKSGVSTMTFSTSLGISTLARSLDVFTADEYRQQVPAVGGTLEDLGASTDWQKEITRTAYTQNHNLAFGGGANKLSYYASLGVQNQQGILKQSDLKRYTGRINVTQKLLPDDRLSLDVNLSASYVNNNRPPIGSMVGGAISANPTYPTYGQDGKPFQSQNGSNPLIPLSLEKDITTANRVVANITPSFRIIERLIYKLNIGVDNSSSVRDLQSLANAVPQQDGRLETINGVNRNTLIENYVTYTLNKTNHSFGGLLGHSYQKFFIQSRSSSINKFPISSIEPIYNPGLGQQLTFVENRPTGFATENELQSFFGRVNYQFKDKYLMTATVRADGSSKFGANNKYGVFPSFSVGWRLSEEEFLKSSPFNDLKLRAGYGKTGNQEIPSKITQALFTSQISSTSTYPITEDGPYVPGTSYVRLANPNIQWEVSNQVDVGLDFALFSNALSGSIDYFNKVSNNILLEVIPADPVQPANTFWTNVPDMEIVNKGIELDLNYRYTAGNGLRANLGGNLTFIDNNVTGSPYSVIPSGAAQGSGLTSATVNGYINGQPIGTFFMKEFTGFDDKGITTFRDTDGDGIVTDKDRVPLGTALPTRQYNINGSLSHKGFDLSFNLYGVAGNKIYDNTANSSFYKNKLAKGVNTTRAAIEYPEESSNNSAPVSSRYLKSGAYFRLNNLSLGYTFDTKSLGIDRYIKGIRLSATGQNLFLITKYDGYDPEVNADRAINGVSSYGIDYLAYPKARNFVFGLNVTL